MSSTSLSCSHDTRVRVKNYMARHGLGSYDAALAHMMDALDGPGAAPRQEAGRRRPRLDEEDDEENERLPALLSYALLSREPRALKYFTGLKPAALDWVMRELRRLVSSFVPFGARGAVGLSLAFGGALGCC
jgi:hypothetical protein